MSQYRRTTLQLATRISRTFLTNIVRFIFVVTIMASVLSGLGGVEPFKVGTDTSSVGQRWDRWKASFDLFVCASGVSDDGQKRALLLHCAGVEVQDIFRTMSDTGTKYDDALAKLDDYFTPRKDVPWERLQFRRTVPLRNETVSNYVIRLKQAAKYCEFGAVAV